MNPRFSIKIFDILIIGYFYNLYITSSMWKSSEVSHFWHQKVMGFYHLYTWVLFILNLITHLKFHIIWAISYMAYNIITILYGLYPKPLFISFPAINNDSNPSWLYLIYSYIFSIQCLSFSLAISDFPPFSKFSDFWVSFLLTFRLLS